MNTPLEKKVVKTKTCCSCLKAKDLETQFHKNTAMKDGRYNRCKICVNRGLNCQPKPSNKKIKKFQREGGLFLTSIGRKDWVEMYDFLHEIGYEIKSDLTIHEQFCKKYNLNTRTRMKEKSKQFTPQELGLI
jgi:phage terminase small subunit